MTPRMKTHLFRLLLVALGLVVGLAIAEMGARIHQALAESPEAKRTGIRRVRSCKGCRHVFELNPRHPDISSQGLRSAEVEVPKPPGSTRILLLGDSVTYGNDVAPERTFAGLLETQLSQGAGGEVEIVNAGVPGYTPYNELYFYLDRGRELEADVVVAVFCMNDVVNPQTHWEMFIPSEPVPLEAFPGLAGDLGGLESSWLGKSTLYRMTRKALYERRVSREGYESVGEAVHPVYLSPESTPSIHVLVDYESSEWQWLRSIYASLRDAVEQEGGRFVLAVVPLAYQLEPAYPYFPQKQFERFCREEQMSCVDVLPAFRSGGKALFQGFSNDWGYEDVWHLSRKGHRVMARELANFLTVNELGGPPTGELRRRERGDAGDRALER
jgi:lysophospholipase L1-like esterase